MKTSWCRDAAKNEEEHIENCGNGDDRDHSGQCFVEGVGSAHAGQAPEDQFAHLVRTIGAERLAYSTWWPLRLTQQSKVLIDLLGDEMDGTAQHARFADGRTIPDRAL